jgi:hypothetical protein
MAGAGVESLDGRIRFFIRRDIVNQAALALDTFDHGRRQAANDNDRGPGDTEGDRWRWIIERLKSIHMPAAVLAATFRLEGMSVDEYGRHMRRAIKACGWPQAQDFDD